MDRSSRDWLAPLAGVAFILAMLVGFALAGEPKSADEPVNEVIEYYVDNKSAIQVSTLFGAAAGLFLIVFGAHLRKVLHAAGGPGEMWSLVAFVGLAIVAVGFAIDMTISFALAEAAEDIEPTAVQALQALWDNDFVPIQLGVLCFLMGTGMAILQTGVLPTWLGWLMLLLVIVGLTPIGFVSAIVSALLVLVLGIMLTLRARKDPATV